MLQFAQTIIKWAIRISFLFTLIIAFIALLNVVVSVVKVGINGSIFGDLIALVQIWAPFNFTMMFNWLTATASIILFFYVSSWAYKTISDFVKD